MITFVLSPSEDSSQTSFVPFHSFLSLVQLMLQSVTSHTALLPCISSTTSKLTKVSPDCTVKTPPMLWEFPRKLAVHQSETRSILSRASCALTFAGNEEL